MPLPSLRVLALSLSVALACGPGDGKTDGESDSATSDSATSDSATDSDTSGAPTTGTTSATDTNTTSSGTTTDNPTTDSPTTNATTDDPTTGDATTGVDISGFQSFKMEFAAGPCPDESDCDGFIELLATRILRVERFGDVDDAVTEVEISEDDFTVAAQEFADPALIALLDGPDPVCDPPTDIFETMQVIEDANIHDAATTGCDQIPVANARDAAQALMMKYVP